ncbi:unsaturated rhamnogalacturonyl hydrolase [Catalinimonas alkaloidigena]|uniref:glycoside hydrolase family 88 protein n=1 Tax=Catalinimonas alkaloidigena TaxID=1075417 RepID=UPI0024069701|nr:glycoside hydrolase family 88 protein [Catalinimonas alkaloidigena]MDF9799363.1 unsaturated rhamnogalacturonyl hydrolase [Catalinimonas alkaloidigena]
MKSKMNRRESITYLSLGCALPFVSPDISLQGMVNLKAAYTYVELEVSSSFPTALPSQLRVPFAWNYFGLGMEGGMTKLSLKAKVGRSTKELRLRLTTALDSREEKEIEVSIPDTDIVLGILDCKYAPVLQLTELVIDTQYLEQIEEKGLQIKLVKGNLPAYFFSDTNAKERGNDFLFPHLLVVNKQNNKPQDVFLGQLKSLGALQPFDWMEGCVLDGLWQIYSRKKDAKALDTIKVHLDLYFDDQGRLIVEDPKSRIADNIVNNIEATLPFAVLARLYPEHPILKKVEQFWEKHQQNINATITAEGAYTIAYPMAVLAEAWNRKDLAEAALHQLRLRKKLVFEGDNYLRYYPEKDSRTYKNWARGLAWYMLGLVRTLSILKDTAEVDDLLEELDRVTQFVLLHQQKNGLWNCFLDNPDTTVDTSGSAGISAAIATGIREGLLNVPVSKAKATWKGLLPFLTPDGLLSGVAQSNRGGEELQRSDYRVISQMGMGLMGQLYAYL